MLPSALITLREVIEASLIVATILGILIKIDQRKHIKIVWIATLCAILVSVMFLGIGSILGFKVREAYTGKVEEVVEGVLMITSSLFITWAVFFLHTYFSKYKVHLLQKVRSTIESREQKGLFILVFTAVFREGFEIVLFLSSIYFSSNPSQIFTGFSIGALVGVLMSLALFTATIRLPIYYAFRTTSLLLILFAAGLLARGMHEFVEVGLFPETVTYHFALIPGGTTFIGSIVKSIFGITQTMDITQITLYVSYTFLMYWWVFIRKSRVVN